jgi:hypothetical protein
MPVAAVASGLLFLGLIAAPLLRRSRTDAPAVAVNYPQQGSAPTASPEVPKGVAASHVPEAVPEQPKAGRTLLKTSPRAGRVAPRNPPPRPTLPVVYVDLKEDDLLRGADESGAARRIITLSPERQRLRLRMPRGSAAGRYTVRIVDAYGKLLLRAAAMSSGRTLTVELDLRGLTTKLYRLCLSRDGEAPDCYLLSVGGNASAQ